MRVLRVGLVLVLVSCNVEENLREIGFGDREWKSGGSWEAEEEEQLRVAVVVVSIVSEQVDLKLLIPLITSNLVFFSTFYGA